VTWVHCIYVSNPHPAMKTRIVSIGNSQGIRIPKLLLEQAGLAGDVELHAEQGRIVIAAIRRPRSGWAEAAAELHARGEDGLIETPAPAFDGEEWEWR
jgi:antitoxin MazE